MIKIPKEELLESLKSGYIEYKNCVAKGNEATDLAHVKGFCVTIEQILSAYGWVTKEEILAIKRPIIGDISLRRKTPSADRINYDTPTIFRKQFES